MTRWSYKVVLITGKQEKISEALTHWGEQGYELVHVTPGGNGEYPMAILHREEPPEGHADKGEPTR